MEQREAKERRKLNVLRKAAGFGFSALDRGEFRQFGSIEDLQAYLNDLSEKVISSADRNGLRLDWR
jgi:antitoxin ParD1/3/4